MWKRFIYWGLLIGLFCHSATADELTPAKLNDIKRLMEVTNSVALANQIASATSKNLFKTLKAFKPEIPDRALAIMEKELSTLYSEKISSPGGLIDQIVPVYHNYLTHQDIKELLAFYQSPIGRKVVVVLPKVFQESMEVGEKWGRSFAPEMETRIIKALDKEGITLKNK